MTHQTDLIPTNGILTFMFLSGIMEPASLTLMTRRQLDAQVFLTFKA